MAIGFRKIENISNAKKIVNSVLVTNDGKVISLYNPDKPVELPITNADDIKVEATKIVVQQKDGAVNYIDAPEVESDVNLGLSVSNFVALNAYNKDKVYLTWQDPQSPDWRYTTIVRKLGSYPVSISDGTVIIRNAELNKYASLAYVDEVVFANTTDRYYYRAFITLQTFELDNTDLPENRSTIQETDASELISGYEFTVTVPDNNFDDVSLELDGEVYSTTSQIINGYSFEVEKTADIYREDIEITLGEVV